MRIKEMIANWRNWLKNKISWSVPLEIYWEEYREYIYWCLGVKQKWRQPLIWGTSPLRKSRWVRVDENPIDIIALFSFSGSNW